MPPPDHVETVAAQPPGAGSPPDTRLIAALPAVLAAVLVALGLLSDAGRNARVLSTLIAAAGVILVWNALLVGSGRRLVQLEIVPRKQHYLQACAQGSVLLYWGWYWRPVYEARRRSSPRSSSSPTPSTCCSPGRGATPTRSASVPFPVIFSINLFLWFKPDWFYLQFLMVALGFAAKELIRWNRDGRRVHIFNPSSFPLAVFSLGADPDGRERHHLGPGDRDHAVLSAAHVPAAVPGRPAGTVLLRRHVDDDVGGR